MHGNRKGPDNEGAKTGRGLGYCNGSDTPGYLSEEAPRGMRRGYGFGRGMGCGFGARGAGRNRLNAGGSSDMALQGAGISSRLETIETLIRELINK